MVVEVHRPHLLSIIQHHAIKAVMVGLQHREIVSDNVAQKSAWLNVLIFVDNSKTISRYIFTKAIGNTLQIASRIIFVRKSFNWMTIMHHNVRRSQIPLDPKDTIWSKSRYGLITNNITVYIVAKSQATSCLTIFWIGWISLKQRNNSGLLLVANLRASHGDVSHSASCKIWIALHGVAKCAHHWGKILVRYFHKLLVQIASYCRLLCHKMLSLSNLKIFTLTIWYSCPGLPRYSA